MKIIEKNIATTPDSPMRFQEYGVGIFLMIPTKSALKKAIKKGLIRIDGDLATTATFIKGGEIIELIEEEKLITKPFIFNLNVLYEDDFLAIIFKTKGISTSGNSFATIANCLAMNLKESPEKDATTPFPVHRLDYDTSGLVLVGKTVSSRQKLHEMFENYLIQKTYHAVTVGNMKPNSGIIDQQVDEKEAVTHYKILKSVKSVKFDALNLVELKPKTGRTHQLRKHLLWIGNPIMGDKKYFLQDKQHKGNGLYLHATALEFNHPIKGEKIMVKSELPKSFMRIFGKV